MYLSVCLDLVLIILEKFISRLKIKGNIVYFDNILKLNFLRNKVSLSSRFDFFV